MARSRCARRRFGSSMFDVRFTSSRSDRALDTILWDVKVTNTSTFDVFLPLVLILDPARGK